LDLDEANVMSLLLDSLVPKLLTDGARNMENEEFSSLEPFLELALEPPLEPPREPWRLETEGLRTGRGVEVTALAIAVMEAGSFSGGEAFHLSRGFR
jgi:hypothetical protein